MIKSCDVLIVGSGIAGIYTALNIRKNLNIILITKDKLRDCNSYLAQGGISTALNSEDIDLFIEDTLKAGNFKNSLPSVETLAKESIDNINKLISFGISFDKNSDGSLKFTKEGGHSVNRIAHIKDETGKYIIESLIKTLSSRENIEIIEECKLIDIIKDKTNCLGGVCNFNEDNLYIHSKNTVLATGGLGGLFSSTTNHPSLTGDGISIALKNDIHLKDISYLQLHPTVLYLKNQLGKRLLLSEALRGEGGVIRNHNKEAFVNPLLPRDIVSSKILKEIEKTPNTPYVYLDLTHLPKVFLLKRFPFLYGECLKYGFQMEKHMLPISPAHHYAMGGIQVNLNSETSMKNLYAVGETACTGVHGNNRLASNSLLEAIVFGNRCANSINNNFSYNLSYLPPRKNDLIKFLKERVDDNYVKLFNN